MSEKDQTAVMNVLMVVDLVCCSYDVDLKTFG